MSYSTDIETDYSVFDGIETVVVLVKKTGEDDVRIDGVKALHLPLGKRDFTWAGSIGISPEDTVWHVWKKTLDAAVNLRPGYWIVQDDVDATGWIIMSCELMSLGTRWRCLTRKTRSNT